MRNAIAYVLLNARRHLAPRTWLLAIGWRRHGRIDPAEVPGALER